MTGTGRGSTGRGRRARLPATSSYPAPPSAAATGSGTRVEFVGEDERQYVFDVAALPLPGWHPALAAALATLIGPAGTRRTLNSAKAMWTVMARFVRALAETPRPPQRPRNLTPCQVEAYFARRRMAGVRRSVGDELLALRMLFRTPALREQLQPEILDQLERRTTIRRSSATDGYTDGELARILRAAREDVARLRDRIDTGELRLTAPAGDDAALHELAATGVVPGCASGPRTGMRRRREEAGQLFVVRSDLEPLLVLLTAVTGRNVETIKELPAGHRVLGGRAVEVQLIKRRRGRGRWHDTATWEIGPPHRELHTPGGLYLLAHRLMARGRGISGATSIWSIWRNAHPGVPQRPEHSDPFAHKLDASIRLPAWAARHELRTDPRPDGSTGPLVISFRRLRTSVEVRRTRAAGGHLPSAARSNSTAVLFADYLRGDATAIDWASEVTADALVEAERAALQAHQQALAVTGAATLTTRSTDAVLPTGPGAEAAWNSCTDPQAHPASGSACRRVSALDCFHCANCVITPAHLPAVLALHRALDQSRAVEGTDRWWKRYGPAWAAIQHDVLPKFTPAELERARTDAPAAPSWLDLVEDPWERP
ncbi:hypothetical protein [Amycolatopsis sp. NPDC004625]|uniref:hypothetical protein n=1 Tax=Amycolatopsis sp. NPDC004625 TaxID=3154670 RepID=UPI00339E612B